MSSHAQVKLLNIVAASTGLLCVLACAILIILIRSQLSDLNGAVLDAASNFQAESGAIWTALKDVDINPNALRNRRETFRQLLGRPLSTSTNIGFSHNQVLFKSIGSTERRRKPITKRPTAAGVKIYSKSHPSPPAAPQTFSYGIQSDVYSNGFATVPPTSGYDNEYTNGGYEEVTVPYGSTVEGAAADSHEFEFEFQKIQIPKCQCNADNQCPPGPPGPKGAPGHPGEPGNDGNPGEHGKIADDVLPLTPPINHCIMCPQGEPGPPGPDGKRGSRGLRGVRGGDGVSGRNGPPGTSGTHGPEGPPGVDGEMGPMGAPGMDGHIMVGLPGSKGTPGVSGEPGPTGDAGIDGHPGLLGVPGVRGGPGQSGKKGSDGLPGEPGIDGDPGQDAEYCACPRQRQYNNAAVRLLRKA